MIFAQIPASTPRNYMTQTSVKAGTVETLQGQIVWSKRDVGKELEVMPHRV